VVELAGGAGSAALPVTGIAQRLVAEVAARLTVDDAPAIELFPAASGASRSETGPDPLGEPPVDEEPAEAAVPGPTATAAPGPTETPAVPPTATDAAVPPLPPTDADAPTGGAPAA